MNDIIKLLLSLSLSGSILAVIIFAIKPAIKHKVSKSIQYYIWIVILFRLVIPFSFEGSIMNNVFYGEQTLWETGSQNVVLPVERASEGKANSSVIPNVKENVANGVYNGDADHSRYYNDLFNQYALYLWFLGLVIALTTNLIGYVRFSKHLKKTNKPASDGEIKMLADLLKGRRNVRLVRNPFVTTPMLMGILRPYIIIPEANFNEKQLKNILLHELAHLKGFDIGVKWLTMIATSIHWFNPLMYFVKKEINRASELACDEAVIKKLNIAEKQAYGDTLISVVAEHKYPVGVLQATMCEEKRTLRERLLAIMKHNKKSKSMVIVSVILIGVFVVGALYLGAGVGTGTEKDTPQYAIGYNLTEISKYKTPYIGDNSRVSAIVNHLPVPDTYFKQRYISMETKNKPYRLKVFYEEGKSDFNGGPWPVGSPESPIYFNLQRNALVLFSMIDNVDEVLFGIRFSQSEGKLEESKYDTWIAFSRASIEELYGSPYELGGNLDSLSAALAKSLEDAQTPKSESYTFIDLDKLPQEYNSQLALKNGDVVYSGGKTYNSSKLSDFYAVFKDSNKDIPKKVRITNYTTEGDAIIHDLSIDSQGVKFIVDYTRDKFGAQEKIEFKVEDIIKEEKNGQKCYTIKVENGKGLFSFYVNEF